MMRLTKQPGLLFAIPAIVGLTVCHAIAAESSPQDDEQSVTLISHKDCPEDGCVYEEGCCGEMLFANPNSPLLPEIEPIVWENCDWKAETGMAIRYRYLHQMNRLRPAGPGLSSYDQWRVNPRVALTYRDTITGYVEAIDASTFGEDLPTLSIDENRADLLQYYVDAKLWESNHGELHARYGRQTLLYGDQHLISPLGWSNTFRNFEGFKAFYQGSDWDVDAFAVRPANGAAQGRKIHVESFDQPDQSDWLNGVYATYRGLEQGSLDLYWIWSLENEPRINRQDGDRHTIGARYYGTRSVGTCCDEAERTWKYDIQGALQVGTDTFQSGGPNQDVCAGFFNAYLEHTWNKVSMQPRLFGLYYLGTGDRNPDDNRNSTYYSLYPLGHAYWGILDNFGGQNLVDYSVGSSVNPTEKLRCTAQWHWFNKHRVEDYIYNVGQAPFGPRSVDPGGTEDSHIGNELDLIATFKVNKNLTLQSGYSWFWYGGAVENTGLNRDDARQFYFLANYRF